MRKAFQKYYGDMPKWLDRELKDVEDEEQCIILSRNAFKALALTMIPLVEAGRGLEGFHVWHKSHEIVRSQHWSGYDLVMRACIGKRFPLFRVTFGSAMAKACVEMAECMDADFVLLKESEVISGDAVHGWQMSDGRLYCKEVATPRFSSDVELGDRDCVIGSEFLFKRIPELSLYATPVFE